MQDSLRPTEDHVGPTKELSERKRVLSGRRRPPRLLRPIEGSLRPKTFSSQTRFVRPTKVPLRLTQGHLSQTNNNLMPTNSPLKLTQGHFGPTESPLRPTQRPLMPTRGPLSKRSPLLGRKRILSGWQRTTKHSDLKHAQRAHSDR